MLRDIPSNLTEARKLTILCSSHDPTQSCCKECQIMSKGTLCRASKDFTCDPEVEFCTGTSGSCPPDVHAPDGTECNGGKTCASGFCTSRLEYCQDWVDSSISGLSSMMDKSRPYKVQGSCYSELLADTPYADVTECEFTCNVLGYTHNGRRTDYCFAPGEREIDESKKYFPEGMECTNPDTPWKISSCINKQCVNTHVRSLLLQNSKKSAKINRILQERPRPKPRHQFHPRPTPASTTTTTRSARALS